MKNINFNNMTSGDFYNWYINRKSLNIYEEQNQQSQLTTTQRLTSEEALLLESRCIIDFDE